MRLPHRPVFLFLTRIARAAAVGAAGALALALAGCDSAPRNPDTAAAPGVTVYGTADAGIGRVAR